MTRLTSSQVVFCSLLVFIHLYTHTTCAPVGHLTHTSSSSSATNSAHSLMYANFHPDLRIVNLASDLIGQVPRKFYFSDCTEKEYHNWYTRKYPIVCQLRFSTANTLKDLVAIYCDQQCGDTYLSYMKKCGPTALKMANHYKKLCLQFKAAWLQWISISGE